MRSRPPAVSLLLVAGLLAAGCGGGAKAESQAPVADAPKASTPAPRKVLLVVDGKRTSTMTTGTTVQEVLAQAQVQLGQHHLVKPSLQSPAATVQVIKVLRLLSAPVTRTVKTPPPVVKKKNSKLPPWSQKVLRKGRPGVKVVQIAWVKRRGKKVKAVIDQTVKRKPVAQIVAVGPQSAAAGSAARLNWKGLANCESHGNPKAVNPAGYYGLYQFSLPSWQSVGGTGKPTDASAAEQTYRAQLLYNKVNGRWQGQWPNCGRFLFT